MLPRKVDRGSGAMKLSPGPMLLGLVAAVIPIANAQAETRTETAVLAGGCYWGMESVYEHVGGVTNVVSGYAGGKRSILSPATDDPDIAEAVRITFDPAQISYDQLLRIYFEVAHDPTQVNRQGPDVGLRYRSAIFPQNARQRSTAQQFLSAQRASGRAIATKIESGGFQLAASDEQDFVRKHPRIPYVVAYDLPKLTQLKHRFPGQWRE